MTAFPERCDGWLLSAYLTPPCRDAIPSSIIGKAEHRVTILTDNGIPFAQREGTENYWIIPFDRLCDALGIEHRLTQINHPWTHGQVERMNRTIKEATVKRYYYQSHDHLKQHLHTFLLAYNFAKRLKTLKGLTPYE